VLRRALANRTGQLCLYSRPAVTIVKFRLVQDFEEDHFWIVRRIMTRDGTPEIRELLDEVIMLD
jgi:hypothetical protein